LKLFTRERAAAVKAQFTKRTDLNLLAEGSSKEVMDGFEPVNPTMAGMHPQHYKPGQSEVMPGLSEVRLSGKKFEYYVCLISKERCTKSLEPVGKEHKQEA